MQEKATSGDKKWIWLENWTIVTVQMKIAEYLAGTLGPKAGADTLHIPEACKAWIK
jgi:hypothetical protein